MTDPRLAGHDGIDMHAYPCCGHCCHPKCKCLDENGNPQPCDFEGHPLPCTWCARYEQAARGAAKLREITG